jgi:DNA-binding PadR family transcriptional regulator
MLPIAIRVVYNVSIVIRVEEADVVAKQNRRKLRGTLDMLILRTLVTGPAHGHTIAQVIEHTSENALEVEQGSLYPALHRLEDRALLSSEWGDAALGRRSEQLASTP